MNEKNYYIFELIGECTYEKLTYGLSKDEATLELKKKKAESNNPEYISIYRSIT